MSVRTVAKWVQRLRAVGVAKPIPHTSLRARRLARLVLGRIPKEGEVDGIGHGAISIIVGVHVIAAVVRRH